MDEAGNIIKISDSSNNHSRKTLKFIYDPNIDILGKGGYGKVYKVKIEKEYPSQMKTYAIKIFEKKIFKESPEKALRVLNEIKIHRSLNHQHLCKYEHSFEDKNNIYILMEYCPYGSLSNLLKKRKKLEEIEIRFYMFQVLKVLKYFRIQKIIHRDLTLSNIFLKDYKTIKISDFGFAIKENEDYEKTGFICGTPGYFTPESNLSKYSYKTDLFYFGMCIYYLFGGNMIFNTPQESFDFFFNKKFEPEKYIKLSKEAKSLLKKLITEENKRIGLDKIYTHPFFNKGKGLDINNFPDYNDKDYMKKIKDLSKKLGIKPIDLKNKKNNINSSSESDNDSNSSDSNDKEINQNNIFNINKRKTYKGNLFNGLKYEENKNNIISDDESEEILNDSKLINYFNTRKHKALNLNQVIYIIQIYDKLIDNCGIGYKLNNKNIGFIFNDSSQMTKINKEKKYIIYHQKDKNTKLTKNIIIKIPPKNITNEVIRKIKILYQMEEEFKNKEIKYIKNNNNINNINEDIYIQKYIKRNNCIIFLLSNNNIQINFFDDIIIIFHQIPKALIYFSKDDINNINIFLLKSEENFSDIKCDNYFINYKIKCALNEIKR